MFAFSDVSVTEEDSLTATCMFTPKSDLTTDVEADFSEMSVWTETTSDGKHTYETDAVHYLDNGDHSCTVTYKELESEKVVQSLVMKSNIVNLQVEGEWGNHHSYASFRV